MPLVNGHRYFPSTAVFLAEVIKFTFFLSMALYEIAKSPQTPDLSTLSELSSAVTRAMFTGDSWKLAIPAMLYALQNNLQYVAADNLDAATFSSAYQLKLFTTAVFGVLLLNRPMSLRKSLSLVMVLIGVAAVYFSADVPQGHILSIHDLRGDGSVHVPRALTGLRDAGIHAAERLIRRSATYEGIDDDVAAANPRSNTAVGFLAVIAGCLLSGTAGVYLEKVLKTRHDAVVSIWVRNVQLSFYSLWPTLFLGVLFMDGEHIAKAGFFTGYNWLVCLLIATQTAGGILVALSLDLGDSISKCYATGASTAITLLATVLFSGQPISLVHVLGTAVILGSMFVFRSSKDEKKLRPPPINVSQYEKSGDANYFDLESVPTPSKIPLRDPVREALSTSRPTTPVNERRHVRPRNQA